MKGFLFLFFAVVLLLKSNERCSSLYYLWTFGKEARLSYPVARPVPSACLRWFEGAWVTNADQVVSCLAALSPPCPGSPAGSTELSLTLDLWGTAVIDLGDFSQALSLLDVGQQRTPTFQICLPQAGCLCTNLQGNWDLTVIGHSICRETKCPISRTSLLQEFCLFCPIPRVKHTHTMFYNLRSCPHHLGPWDSLPHCRS